MLASWCAIGIAVLILLYLLLRFNSLWIYWFDRALRDERNSLSPEYELPRYFRADKSGNPNLRVTWPGWDGWYFVAMPRDREAPARMVRASTMTGLYGLDGIDNYSILPNGLSPFYVVESLMLIPVEGANLDGPGLRSGESAAKQNYFAHGYIPKTNLRMSAGELQVAIHGTAPAGHSGAAFSGQLSGKWPDYSFHFFGTQAGVKVDLQFRGENLVWWADLPGIFTYFSAFGEFTGTMSVRVVAGPAGAGTEAERTFPVRGKGAFEHGFARKPFNYDLLYSPIRAIQTVFRGYRPIRYHYECLESDDGMHGGWMRARGFGIDFRNLGGFYLGRDYIPIQSVDVEYAEPEKAPLPPSDPCLGSTVFYRRWKVRAKTVDGILEYVAKREWPAAPVASNMTYYYQTFEGSYRGKQFRGQGYGEYLNM